MKFCLNFRTVLASSACAIIFLPAAATAQSQTESAEPAPVANSAVMDDIVVTARRTAENIQSTPVSVTAFSGDMLRQSSIRATPDLLIQTPGVFLAGAGRTARSEERRVGKECGIT